MAASGFTPISLYYSTTASAVPTSGNLANGELGLNIADMKLYAKNSAGTVTLLASSGGATGTVSSVAATVPAFLSISGSPITTSGTLAISLSGSALPTTSGGTGLTSFNANGVMYASSSSVLATGSQFTFDGTNVKIGVHSFAPNTNLAGNLLQLKTAGGIAYLTMGNGDGANQTNYIGSASDVTVFGSVTDAGATTERMRLTSIGLGIGTSSPAQKLHVNVASGNIYGQFSSGANNVYIGFEGAGGSRNIGVIESNTSLAFDVGSSYTERFRIASTGAFGLSGANYGNAGEVLTSQGSSSAPTWAAAGGGSGFTAKTANYTAASGDNILANTSSGSWTLTLPASPSTGNSVQVMDSIGTFGQYPLTVARNGSTIMSAAENMTLDVNGAATTFVYNGSTWRVI